MKLKKFNFEKVNDIFDELEFYKFKKELNILDLNKKKINKI